jgi:hypothetical protein
MEAGAGDVSFDDPAVGAGRPRRRGPCSTADVHSDNNVPYPIIPVRANLSTSGLKHLWACFLLMFNATQHYLIVKLRVRKSAKSVIVTIPKVAQTSGIRRFALWALGFDVSLVTTMRPTPPRAVAIRKGPDRSPRSRHR